MKRTKLLIAISCKKCKATYAAHAIYGGLEIDGDFTMEMAEAEEKGDIVELLDNKSVTLGTCKCK